ncbi:MAG: 5'/3'-nucleotidase SurE [Prevotellaceae bacterium]|jgi:5'-nucleotidase|nr:5'/3'-nucleotidase SurE [Prevotellaceae bacterium]
MQKPLILITNDDGIRAKGLRALIEIAKPIGRVLVVAPEEGHSGESHAITTQTPLRLRQLQEPDGGDEVIMYACNGTPVDCVKLGMTHLLDEQPDLVLSGINHGSNASINVVYSGTMAAAQEASLSGTPAIGFSLLDYSPDADFSSVQAIGGDLISKALKFGLGNEICLNVNVPALPLQEIKGVKFCRQANGTWEEGYDQRADPYGGKYFWLSGRYSNNEPDATDTDEWALSNGYVSVVPVQPDMTSYKELERLKREWQ